MELNNYDNKHQDLRGLPSDQHIVRDKVGIQETIP